MPLAVQHALHSFTDTEEFLDFVEAQDAYTTRQLITAPRDIALTKDGKLASNGFLLTHTAFKQLCQHTAKGLYGLVADIGAVAINTRSTEQFTSAALSADIINKVVDLRFHAPDGISTKAMILNAQTKTVDGIVGARYRYVPHHQLYVSVRDCVGGALNDMRFARGIVCGRRCAFTFADTGHLYGLGHGYLTPCLHFTNSEAGEAGIHATVGLSIAEMQTELFMTDRAHLKHIAHSNHDFDSRLANLVSGAVNRFRGIQLGYHVGRLNESLGVIAGGLLGKAERKKLISSVAKFTGAALAEHVVRKAIFQGAERNSIPAQVSATDIAQRTKRDLVTLLCREGVGRCHSTREALEAAAFHIIA